MSSILPAMRLDVQNIRDQERHESVSYKDHGLAIHQNEQITIKYDFFLHVGAQR